MEAAQKWSERHLHCVHGMFMAAGDLAVAGFGGRITAGERKNDAASIGGSTD